MTSLRDNKQPGKHSLIHKINFVKSSRIEFCHKTELISRTRESCTKSFGIPSTQLVISDFTKWRRVIPSRFRFRNFWRTNTQTRLSLLGEKTVQFPSVLVLNKHQFWPVQKGVARLWVVLDFSNPSTKTPVRLKLENPFSRRGISH